jgi:hypothetical protein
LARKTFISYKYSESQDLRDLIVKALGKDATYYQGETSDSPNLTDTSTDNIKKNLTDMMFSTSVTIIVLSPNMLESNWIGWEIEYSLKEINREGRNSSINGVVGVIMKVNGSYDWLMKYGTNCHRTTTISYTQDGVIQPIITKNKFNSNPPIWHCSECKTYSYLEGSYISYIKEEAFLDNPTKYIESAFEKSKNTSKYDITKTI